MRFVDCAINHDHLRGKKKTYLLPPMKKRCRHEKK